MPVLVARLDAWGGVIMGCDMDLGVRQTWLPTQRLQLPCRVRSGMLFNFSRLVPPSVPWG